MKCKESYFAGSGIAGASRRCGYSADQIPGRQVNLDIHGPGQIVSAINGKLSKFFLGYVIHTLHEKYHAH
jgi:hypothetical protein